MRNIRLDEMLASLNKPRLEVSEQVTIAQEDALIVCAGFEDRSIEVLKRTVAAGARRFKVVHLEYLPRIEANRSRDVMELCSAANAVREVVVYDRRNPEGGADRICEAVAHAPGTIHLDVSGMSRLLIVQCLVAARRICRIPFSMRIWYCEAESYPPSEAEVQKAIEAASDDPMQTAMFLSSGVFGVTILPELAAAVLRGAPVRLIAFPSFNTAQLVALRADVPASAITIVNGVPPRRENSWRAESLRTLNHVDGILNADEVWVSTLDYRETLEMLLEKYRASADHEKFVIAPTGSKMQAVAVGILRAFLADIEIAYPTPENFETPERYSHGVQGIYSLDVSAFAAIDSR